MPALLCDLIKPETKGNVVISHFSPTLEESISTMVNQNALVPPGRYVRLQIGGKVMMSDTPMEIRSCAKPILEGHGNMLVIGLGLGMILHRLWLIGKLEWTKITIIEKNQNVIDLISPYFVHPNIKIIQADAFTWRPWAFEKYDCIWIDIWPDRSDKNMPEMKKTDAKVQTIRGERRMDRMLVASGTAET